MYVYFKIHNRASGCMLTIGGGSRDDGALVTQAYALPGGSYLQYWGLHPGVRGGFQIRSAVNGKCVDDPRSSKRNGAGMILYHIDNGMNQEWVLGHTRDGYVTFKNMASGKVLDNPGSSTSAGVQIIQWDLDGGTNQHWWFET